MSYIVKNTPEASPNTFCGLILQNGNNPNVCPHEDDRFDWKVELPEKSKTAMVRTIKRF
jgi:hypothetical protein